MCNYGEAQEGKQKENKRQWKYEHAFEITSWMNVKIGNNVTQKWIHSQNNVKKKCEKADRNNNDAYVLAGMKLSLDLKHFISFLSSPFSCWREVISLHLAHIYLLLFYKLFFFLFTSDQEPSLVINKKRHENKYMTVWITSRTRPPCSDWRG